MGLSRETRIITLLVLDTVFFFIELFFGPSVSPYDSQRSLELETTCGSLSPLGFTDSKLVPFIGYAVGSIALIADSFHMLK